MNFRRPFRFDGETTDGLKISAEQCAAFFTEIKQNGSLPVPLIISRIHTNVLKVYNPNKLENLEEGTYLRIEIGLLNYYSTATNFLINTEIGYNSLIDHQTTISRYSRTCIFHIILVF